MSTTRKPGSPEAKRAAGTAEVRREIAKDVRQTREAMHAEPTTVHLIGHSAPVANPTVTTPPAAPSAPSAPTAPSTKPYRLKADAKFTDRAVGRVPAGSIVNLTDDQAQAFRDRLI